MNVSANQSLGASSSHIPPDASLEFIIVKIMIYVVIFVMTIIGNVLVITVIRYNKKMRGSSHILILNLAVCDLITPTISIPFDLAYEELKYAWPFGGGMCKVLWPAQTFTATSSALILTAICIDRYRALVYPFKVRWAGKFSLMVFSMYTFALAVVVPYMLVLHLDEGEESIDCSEKWPSPQKAFRQTYTIVLFLSQYALPLVIMITLYSITLRSLFINSKQLLSESSHIKEAGSPIRHTSRTRRELSIHQVRKEQHLKVTKMFITVVIVFAVSIFPNQVLWLWVDFGNLADNDYFPTISIICRIFTYSNSVLNPFIYGLYSKDFRSGYKTAGRKISKIKNKHQSWGNRKSRFKSSYTSTAIDEGKTLLTRNKKATTESKKGCSVTLKKSTESNSKESNETKHFKNCLNEENQVLKFPMDDKTSSAPVETKPQVSDAKVDLTQTDEREEAPAALGDEVEQEKREQENIENIVLGIKQEIYKCLRSQNKNHEKGTCRKSLNEDLVEYLNELAETQC